MSAPKDSSAEATPAADADDTDGRSPRRSGEASSKPARSKAKAKPRPRAKAKVGRVGRATRRAAVDRPQEIIASRIDAGGSLFWGLALGTVALILLSLVVRNATKATRMFDAMANGVVHAAFPAKVFPEKYGATTSSTTAPTRTGTTPIPLAPTSTPRRTSA